MPARSLKRFCAPVACRPRLHSPPPVKGKGEEGSLVREAAEFCTVGSVLGRLRHRCGVPGDIEPGTVDRRAQLGEVFAGGLAPAAQRHAPNLLAPVTRARSPISTQRGCVAWSRSVLHAPCGSRGAKRGRPARGARDRTVFVAPGAGVAPSGSALLATGRVPDVCGPRVSARLAGRGEPGPSVCRPRARRNPSPRRAAGGHGRPR